MKSLIHLFLDEEGYPSQEFLSKVISDFSKKHDLMYQMYKEYVGKSEILSRVFSDPMKINNKLVNSYQSDIIDTLTGYVFGKPITYVLDDHYFKDSEMDLYYKINSSFKDFLIYNSIDDLDSSTGKLAGICGYGSRLLFINDAGKPAVMNVFPWETIFFEENTNNSYNYALRYYEVPLSSDIGETHYVVEWYNTKEIFILESTDLENFVKVEHKPHMFNGVPLIQFKNNDELQGDFEKVRSLIDAYERLLSDSQNEIEEFRQAYMLFEGVEIDQEFIKKARQTGGIQVPLGAKVSFLTKNINSEFIENQKKTLNDNIYKFSKTVDMSAEGFSGSSTSGEARRWQLLGLENKATVKERKFSAALREQFRVLSSVWTAIYPQFDYADIFWTFSRNTPAEVTLEADIASKLKDIVSQKTLLSNISLVDDVEWEMSELQNEKAALEEAAKTETPVEESTTEEQTQQ